MTNPIDPTQLAYLFQHLNDLSKITKTQISTLVLSSLGAAGTAFMMVNPTDWKLVGAAFVGALLTNLLHLIQAPPGEHDHGANP